MTVLGVVVGIAGLALVMWSRLTLGRYWSGVVGLKEDHQLIECGPHRLVRHPLYTGLIMATIGTAVAETMLHALIGVGLIVICVMRRARKEDNLLGEKFGAACGEYRRHTGRLVPWIG
jgi:protein-S-isoprenylcysteine O-methyltransferase Ste14